MASRNFQRFVESFLGDPAAAAHDGLDLQVLHHLLPEERAQAEAMLLERLTLDDSRAAVGLGELGTQAAIAPLRALLEQAGGLANTVAGSFLVDVALALWKLNQEPDALLHIRNVLTQSSLPTVRMSAAIALKQLRCQGAAEALRAALHDESGLVRNHAARSLLGLHGLWTDEFESPPLALQVMSSDPAVRDRALAELTQQSESLPLPPC